MANIKDNFTQKVKKILTTLMLSRSSFVTAKENNGEAIASAGWSSRIPVRFGFSFKELP